MSGVPDWIQPDYVAEMTYRERYAQWDEDEEEPLDYWDMHEDDWRE